MPHRFRFTLTESLKFDSWLSRHALARSFKEKMQQETGAARAPTVAPQPGDSRVASLSSDFGRLLSTSDTRPPCILLRRPTAAGGIVPTLFAPTPRYPGPFQQYYLTSLLISGRGFHTTRCYSPQFPNETQQVMHSREANEGHRMVQSGKRSWEDDRRAAFSTERNRSKYLPAEEYKRHHRSRSCDGPERNLQQPGFSEEELRADVRRLRTWQYTDFGRDHRMKPMAGVEFTVMTYNVLAQCLLVDNGYLYQHCDPKVLPWEFRKVRILKELAEANADVLCLQEIQCDHYEGFFVPELGKLGYTGRYKKRTGNKNDGCAIFFRHELFALNDCASVEYSKPGLSLLDRDRDNIALVAMLQSKRGGGKICVVNTHLLFNPGRGDIKLAQLRILLAEIDRFAFRRPAQHSREPHYHPVILCGDMNSEPNCSLYEFVSTGALHYEGLVAGDISGQAEGYRRGRFCLEKELIPEQLGISDQCQYVDAISARTGARGGTDGQPENARSSANSEEKASASCSAESSKTFSTGKMTHRLNFVSAYGHRLGRARGMQHAVTTHHRKGSCMVDYIFYSVHSKNSSVRKSGGGQRVEHRDTKDGSLSLIATYGLLSCEELTRLGGLPNSVLPSDHLTLVARFLLRNDS